MMWARFDTLLVRLLALMGVAVASTFVFSFLVAEMQQSARAGLPRTSMSVAMEALDTLREEGWPASLSSAELKALELDLYSRTEQPLGRDTIGMFPDMVRDRLDLDGGAAVAVSLDADWPAPMPYGGPGKPESWPGKRPLFGSDPLPVRKAVASVVSVELAANDWVNVKTKRIAHPRGSGPWVILFALVLLVATAILAARNAISPLKQMARAADVLAADYKHQQLDEFGPYDVRQALHAFNRMGRQLESTVSSQRQVLAAIGHDLRTPITSLKLKTEMLSDPEERTRMMRAIAELEHLTEAALIAASAGQSGEAFERLDIYSIIDSVAEELSDLGNDVVFEDTDDRPIVRGRAGELMRVLRNVVENAVYYGDRARIRLSTDAGVANILIEDDGPGIPEDAAERVFQPLVRLEQSRSRETGGHGLGLHIAKTLIEAHHGTIRLSNRSSGGLRVEITLPRDHV